MSEKVEVRFLTALLVGVITGSLISIGFALTRIAEAIEALAK